MKKLFVLSLIMLVSCVGGVITVPENAKIVRLKCTEDSAGQLTCETDYAQTVTQIIVNDQVLLLECPESN